MQPTDTIHESSANLSIKFCEPSLVNEKDLWSSAIHGFKDEMKF